MTNPINTMKPIEMIYNSHMCEALTRKLLLSLASRGNMHAYDIMTGKNNGLVTVADIASEMYLYLLEYDGAWELEDTEDGRLRIVFNDDEIESGFIRIVSNTMYKETRHSTRKNLYVEMDGEEVNITDISTMASHVCIDKIVGMDLYSNFITYLHTTMPKKATLYADIIELRLRGHKINDIAHILNIKLSAAYDAAKKLKTVWRDYECTTPHPIGKKAAVESAMTKKRAYAETANIDYGNPSIKHLTHIGEYMGCIPCYRDMTPDTTADKGGHITHQLDLKRVSVLALDDGIPVREYPIINPSTKGLSKLASEIDAFNAR